MLTAQGTQRFVLRRSNATKRPLHQSVDGRNLASLLKQIHAISLRLAPRPLLNIGAQFGQVGLGHARFRPLTTYERLCSSQLNVK